MPIVSVNSVQLIGELQRPIIAVPLGTSFTLLLRSLEREVDCIECCAPGALVARLTGVKPGRRLMVVGRLTSTPRLMVMATDITLLAE